MLNNLTNNSKAQSKLQKGFTIIEVLIVLAIAGLILVVVLIAIPQLQRNQRNEQRRSIAARVVTEINSYSGNNNGDIPTTSAELGEVSSRYLGCSGTPVSCEVNITGPQSGVPMAISYQSAPAVGPAPDGSALYGHDILYYANSRLCDGEQIKNGNGRNFALWTVLEGGAVSCLDNS